MQEPARVVLLEHLRQSARGRLVVRDGGVEVSVFVQDGTLIAAQADDDGKRLYERLQREGVLDADKTGDLEDALARVPGIGPVLDVVAVETLAVPLRDRFVDNLARFLSAGVSPTFEPSATLFVDNPQTVNDPVALLDLVAVMVEEAGDLDVESEVQLGLEVPIGERESRLAQLVDSGVTRIADILERVPEEPFAGRVLVAQMIGRGELVPGQHALRHRTPATPIQRVDDELSLRELGLPIDPGTTEEDTGRTSLPVDWASGGKRTPAPAPRATPSALHPRASRFDREQRATPASARPGFRGVWIAVAVAVVVVMAVAVALLAFGS